LPEVRSKELACRLQMSMSTPVKFAVAALVAALLIGVGIKLRNQSKQAPGAGPANIAPRAADAPSCTGVVRSSTGAAPPEATRPVHSVTLSWHAVVPVSSSSRDAIKGYYVYRSLASRNYAESNRISELPVQGTRCVDTTVEPQRTYFYVVKAVTEGGTQSGSSVEIRAVVPSP
jgi:hypothetical protein